MSEFTGQATVNHDSLFKWLITLFTQDFFRHYFPDLEVGEAAFLDKEFIKKFDLNKSLEGDLLLLMQVRIDGKMQSVMVYIEHKGQKMNPGKQIMEYAAYAWLYKKLPVWSIALFTDDARWRKEVPDRCWFGWTKKEGKLHYPYDIIKVNREKSAALIAERSLFTSLLALKADAKGLDREDIIRSIFQCAREMVDRLTNKHILLIHHFINAYGRVTPQALNHIEEESGMTFIATSIEEHFIHLGEEKGLEIGLEKGREEGLLALKGLFDDGLISEEVYLERVATLKKESLA